MKKYTQNQIKRNCSCCSRIFDKFRVEIKVLFSIVKHKRLRFASELFHKNSSDIRLKLYEEVTSISNEDLLTNAVWISVREEYLSIAKKKQRLFWCFPLHFYLTAWFGLIYLFNGISTTYGLSNTKILFTYLCLVVIITIFLMFRCVFLFVYNHLLHIVVGDRSWGRQESSLFNGYYTEALLLYLDCSTLPLIRNLYRWVLSKAVSSTIFKAFGMTRPRIEPRSPGPLANTVPTMCRT